MALFGSYIFVDWSAKNSRHRVKSSPDAPWVGEYTPADEYQRETYHRTRQSAIDHVLGRLIHHKNLNRRVLIGFDFPYGYPQHTAQVLGFSDGQNAWCNIWAELSSRITDNDSNESNRFSVASDLNRIISNGRQGPFWGCPPKQATQHLGTKSPGFPFIAANGLQLDRLRICEDRLKGVQEVWKLLGAGCVGSQALTGIPRVHALRYHEELKDISVVWPFETGFNPSPTPEKGPFILHAEIWPGIVDKEVRNLTAKDLSLIRDQAQVRALCNWAAELDRKDGLGSYFDVPTEMDTATMEPCIKEEGWVLGIGWVDKGKTQPVLETDKAIRAGRCSTCKGVGRG